MNCGCDTKMWTRHDVIKGRGAMFLHPYPSHFQHYYPLSPKWHHTYWSHHLLRALRVGQAPLLTPSFTHVLGSSVLIGHESALFHIFTYCLMCLACFLYLASCLARVLLFSVLWGTPLVLCGTLRYLIPPPLYYLNIRVAAQDRQ